MNPCIRREHEADQDDQDREIHDADQFLILDRNVFIVLLVLLGLGPLDEMGKEGRSELVVTVVDLVVPRHQNVGEHGQHKRKDHLVLPVFLMGKEVDAEHEASKENALFIQVEWSSEETTTHLIYT
jgi:hypothetical protein